MKLLVTGASGFVGRVFLKHLVQSPNVYQIDKLCLVQYRAPISDIRLDRLKSRINVQLIQHNLEDPWMFDLDVDTVLNLAADGSENSYSQESTIKFGLINRNLLAWSRKQQLERVIHISSGICDYFDANPRSPILLSRGKMEFAAGRRNIEEELSAYFDQQGISIQLLRLYSFIGEELMSKQQYAISDFIKQAQQTGIVRVRGNSNSLRTYLSETDLGDVIEKTVFKVNFSKRVSVASSESVSMKQLAKAVAIPFNARVSLEGESGPVENYTPEYAKEVLPKGADTMEYWKDTLANVIERVKKGVHGI